MNNEKGLSLIEVIWAILIIGMICSSTFIYEIKLNKKIKESIIEKVYLIEYFNISQLFKINYDNFDEVLDDLNYSNNLYTFSYPYLNSEFTLKLYYKKEELTSKTKYVLSIIFPEELKLTNSSLFYDKEEVIII